jgi:hypothetical protein
MDKHFVKLACAIHIRKDLTGTAKVVYSVIVDKIGDNATAWPGLRWIADNTGTTKDTAKRAVDLLEKLGLLVVERAGKGSGSYYSIPGESVIKTMTVENKDCHQNKDTTVIKTRTEVSSKQGHIQKDPINRPILSSTGENSKESTQGNITKSQEVFDYWNLKAIGTSVPNAKTLNHGRRKQIKNRLKDPDFARDFKAIIDRIYGSDFLIGKNGTWSITFDWFIKNDANWLKIHEGNYDNKGDQGDGDGPPHRFPGADQLRELGIPPEEAIA